MEDEEEETGEVDGERPTKVRRHLPPGTGPHSVGCVDIMTDATDSCCFFRLFYPIAKTDIIKRDTQWPHWLPRKQYGFGFAHFLPYPKRTKKLMGRFFNWLGGDLYIPALWQAPLTESDEKYPVLILSHGIGGNRTIYSTFCCELASHGIVVASLEHRDGSASMTYDLKDAFRRNTVEVVKETEVGRRRRDTMHRSHSSSSFVEHWKPFEHTDPFGIRWDDFTYRNKQVQHRAAECSRLLDTLEDINRGASVRNLLGFHFSLKQFKDRFDMSRVAFAGHSFGGSTCVPTLANDTRFRVGVMLDAWMHPLHEQMCRRVSQPLLMVNYEKFQWQMNLQMMDWLQADGVDRTTLTIMGACHQAVSDFQFLGGKRFCKLMDVRTELSPDVCMRLNCDATLGFLRKHLDLEDKEYHEDILSGRHELVTLGTKLKLTRPNPHSRDSYI